MQEKNKQKSQTKNCLVVSVTDIKIPKEKHRKISIAIIVFIYLVGLEGL